MATTNSIMNESSEKSSVTAPVASVREMRKTYSLGETEVHALRGITVSIAAGEFVAIMGASGSGKSTFMNILGCLDRPTSGEYRLEGTDVSQLNKKDLARIRNQKIGFVFQGFNLLGRTTALENTELPMLYSRIGKKEREQRAREALTLVGLGDRLEHFPSQMSGGQQQRVAVARALVNQPRILLADEPTGNLDSANSRAVLEVLRGLNERMGQTILMITHNPEAAAYGHRIVHMQDGRVTAAPAA